MSFAGCTSAFETFELQTNGFGTNNEAVVQQPIPAQEPAAAASPASADDDIGERRLRRKISNRESARRSRARKQSHLDDLRALAARLQGDRGELAERARAARGRVALVQHANAELRAEAAALSRRLEVAASRALALNQLYAAAAGVGTFEQTLASLMV
ncbi:basic leucine zipper 1-like [Lolium perenne]|uniref:basic leucine zipper 1-like n=1 Tax=Lolium perenne TaxID=4522 RepID=UPI0021EACCFF|nr:ocs element-binding factor 1-like [Lolium perenne]